MNEEKSVNKSVINCDIGINGKRAVSIEISSVL